jgi:hypothetical protein
MIRDFWDFAGTPIETDLIDWANLRQKIPRIHVSTIHASLHISIYGTALVRDQESAWSPSGVEVLVAGASD